MKTIKTEYKCSCGADAVIWSDYKLPPPVCKKCKKKMEAKNVN